MLSIWLKFLSCRCALVGSSSVEELSGVYNIVYFG